MKYKALLLYAAVVIVVAGIGMVGFYKAECTPTESIVYINNTVTETKEVIVKEYINKTEEKVVGYSQEYVNTFIRDYDKCRAEMTFLNKTDIEDMKDMYYDLNISLSRCEDKIETLKELI